MSDIVFIKNEEDYLNYKKLKPVKFYNRQKVKFICKCCHNESIKAFCYLTLDFLCGKCKSKQTCKNKYGVENPSQVEEFRQKSKITCYKKYGVDNYSKSVEFEKHRKQTCQEKYGVDNPFQYNSFIEKIKQTNIKKYNNYSFAKTEEFKKLRQQTCQEKYGVDNPFQCNNHKEKSRLTCLLKYNVENYRESEEAKELRLQEFIKKLTTYNLTLLNKDTHKITIKCNKCNTDFTFSISHFYTLLKQYNNDNFCPCCSHTNLNGKSIKEKELLNYIKTIYNKQIEENTRTIISPKELDIYIPELKLGIEFDGIYFHADSRFYKETDIIERRKMTAKEIWEKDKEKDLLCKSKGIKLIRIKEYDWDNYKIHIKLWIKILISKLN